MKGRRGRDTRGPSRQAPADPLARRGGRFPIALVVAALLAAAWSVPAAAEEGSPRYAGRPLAEVLHELQAQGLKIFFTSKLVRPELVVADEPETAEPRALLDELLAPHGLKVEPGPGGRLVVVAGELPRSAIRGLVRERESGTPIAGVRILLADTGHETASGADGGFTLDGIVPGSYRLEAHLPGFVVERREVELAPGKTVDVILDLAPAPLALDEIVVTPSRVTLLREEPVSGLDLDRNDIFALPHFGDDLFRAVNLLPGVSSEEVSARFNVRGGRDDEVLVLLDQAELFEPYHLKDYGSRVSIVAPRALREVSLITGGYPVQYGDRMSGVLDMSTVEPERRRVHLGLGILGAELGASGAFRGQRGQWLAVFRRAHLDVALDLLDIRENPAYWDVFAKVELALRPRQRFGLHVLHSQDTLDFHKFDTGADTEKLLTDYGNTYLWLTHQAVLGPRLYVDSAATFGRIDRDRRGIETVLEPDHQGDGFRLVDRRRLDVVGLKQDWSSQTSDRQFLRWGFGARRLTTDYDYLNQRQLEDPLADVRAQPRTGVTRFDERLRGDQMSLYLSDRLRPVDAVTFELGLRYDEHTLTDDRNTSPRFNLVWAVGRRSALRAAWGYFFQSQRPYELQVEDGVTELARAERTEQRVLGFEHAFGARHQLRVEAYERLISNPRPRYENLYEPVPIFPEIELDRVLFAPERSRARGVELLLRGSRGRLRWWVSYVRSRIEDRIDGRDVPRRLDQPHALTLDLNVRAGRQWNLNLAWRYHTGWPTTALGARVVESAPGGGDGGDGEEGGAKIVPVVGPFHAERLPPYHRLDLRASREWKKRKVVLGFFLEIQNVYNRENVAGFDIEAFQFGLRPDGSVDVQPVEEKWDGFLPSFGITWEF